ncbi:MAG: CBS domain-containing protein [Candidatus Dormibacteraceae bacterium]
MPVFRLMRRCVVTVSLETTVHQIVRLLANHRVSGVPVIDEARRVLGVVSATDLLRTKEEATPHGYEYSHRASRVVLGRVAGRFAFQVMSAPALVIGPETPVLKAAELMQARHVKRLPVVDPERRLLGIVTRSDLLELFLDRAARSGSIDGH